MRRAAVLLLAAALVTACSSSRGIHEPVREDGTFGFYTLGDEVALESAREQVRANEPAMDRYDQVNKDLWRAFERSIREGDKLHWYSTSDESFQDLCGEAGFAVVRNGVVVNRYLFFMN